jgi:hypothetical protein
MDNKPNYVSDPAPWVEDTDLQQALRLSAEEAGTTPELNGYGVSYNQNLPSFGPANKGASYDDNQWAMVPLGSAQATEILPDADPADRKRTDGLPAFIKPSVEDNKLASLLTIYHEIPLAREKLLARKRIPDDYGYHPEWWAGKPIEPRIPITMMDDGPPSYEEATKAEQDEFVQEVQRLMAFLSKTERSYGSSEALLHLMSKQFRHGMDPESQFFEQWREIFLNDPEAGGLNELYTQAVQPSVRGEAEQDKIFNFLDLELPSEFESSLETIYDVTDRALWNGSGPNVEERAYLARLGDVISFRLAGDADSNNVRIPAVWFPDRYLKENAAAALEFKRRQAAIAEEIRGLEVKQGRIEYASLPNGKQIRVKDLIEAACAHDEAELATPPEDLEQYDTDMDAPLIQLAEKGDLTAELKKLMRSIDRKLEELEMEKEKTEAAMRHLGRFLTEAGEGEEFKPRHRYTLRGVATSKFVTYVKRRAEEDLMDMETPTEADSPATVTADTETDADAEPSNPSTSPHMTDKETWYRLEWSTSSASRPIFISRVTEQEVLTAAYRDSKSVIVVYASEKAMQCPVGPLPEQLEDFVNVDNLSFEGELATGGGGGDEEGDGGGRGAIAEDDDMVTEVGGAQEEGFVESGGWAAPDEKWAQGNQVGWDGPLNLDEQSQAQAQGQEMQEVKTTDSGVSEKNAKPLSPVHSEASNATQVPKPMSPGKRKYQEGSSDETQVSRASSVCYQNYDSE